MDDPVDRDVTDAVVEAFFDRERAVRSLLDDLDGLALRGEHEAVRERVRAFADADREAFFAVALALADSPHFFGDVESRLGVEPADDLRDLAETYATLSRPFGLVRMEVAEDRHNPVTGLDVTTSYEPDGRLPMVAYTVHSGNVALQETRGSPSEVLAAAVYLLRATNDALEATLSGDHAVNTDELSELIDRREAVETELGTLRDRLDAVREAPGSER